MPGKVVQIFICSVKGQPMEEVAEVYASRETGLAGDRYGSGRGSWSKAGKNDRQVTLIAFEALEAANNELPTTFLPSETRRNILTRGIDVNALVGLEFSIGEARLRGTKLCDPCQRPPLLAGREMKERRLFPVAFENRGGLCAEVIKDGRIRVDDPIIYE